MFLSTSAIFFLSFVANARYGGVREMLKAPSYGNIFIYQSSFIILKL